MPSANWYLSRPACWLSCIIQPCENARENYLNATIIISAFNSRLTVRQTNCIRHDSCLGLVSVAHDGKVKQLPRINFKVLGLNWESSDNYRTIRWNGKRRPRISNFKKTQKRFQSIQIIIKCITPDLKDFKDCNQEILFNSRPNFEINHFLEMFIVIFRDFRTELKFRTDRFDSVSSTR